MWASADGFEIQVQGAGGHGAFPHLTVNPINAAAQIALGLPGLVSLESNAQETLVLSLGEFQAGTAYNIIPDTARMSGSLRTLDDTARDLIMQRIHDFSQTVASAHRAEARLTWSPHTCPCLINHAGLAELVHACAVESEGADSVDKVKPSLASDDMSLFLRERPGCYFKIGAALDGPERPHHSPHFAIDDRALAVALRVSERVVRKAASRPS
jgi:amidohydrolase